MLARFDPDAFGRLKMTMMSKLIGMFFLGVFVITATPASAVEPALADVPTRAQQDAMMDMVSLADKASSGDKVALHKLVSAANRGIDPAQLQMGMLYAVGGTAVSQNDTTALYWFRKAANHLEDDTAQYNLAAAYEYGHGTPRNHIVSYALYKLAFAAQFPPDIATEQIKKFTAKMTTQQIAEGDALVLRMKNKKIGVIKAIDQYIGRN